jgi:hypothetical protein
MTEKPHIVRLVADEARRNFYDSNNWTKDWPRPRLLKNEIGVEFQGEFIPYADLGYNDDIGFFRLSERENEPNDAAPYASSGSMIDCGQIIVTTGASLRLSSSEIRELLLRHARGDYGEFGEYYDLDVDDDLLAGNSTDSPGTGVLNKVNTLTGLSTVFSAYTVKGQRILVVTEAGEKRSTVLFFAGAAQD